MLRSLNFSRLLAAQRRMPSSCGGAARSAAAGRGLATEHTTGPGLPVAGVMSEEQEKKTSDRLYEGDKVEDAPRAKVLKPEQEQPAAQDIDQGTGAERVRTPTSPGREETDAAEPKGGPM